MKSIKNHIHFDQDGHLTQMACDNYLSNELLGSDRNAIEKHCLNCKMCGDILEGAETLGKEYGEVIKSAQNQTLDIKVRWWRQYRIAAVIVLLISSGFVLVYITSQFNNPEPNIVELLEVEKGEPEKLVKDSMATQVNPVQSQTLSPQPETTDPVPEVVEATAPVEVKQDAIAQQAEETLLLQENIVEAMDMVESEQLARQDEEPITTMRARAAPAEVSGDVPQAALEQLEEKAQESRIVTGRVLSEADDPLSGVNVILPGTIYKTITDASGYYELAVPDSTSSITYAFPETAIVAAASRSDKRKSKSSENMLQFTELVISSETQITDQLEVIKVPQPINGRRELDEYLQTNIMYPTDARANNIKGKVVLEFQVNQNGSLSDFTVIKSLGFGCDEEAIRVLKEGPTWRPGTINTEPKTQRIRVRIKFGPAE